MCVPLFPLCSSSIIWHLQISKYFHLSSSSGGIPLRHTQPLVTLHYTNRCVILSNQIFAADTQ